MHEYASGGHPLDVRAGDQPAAGAGFSFQHPSDRRVVPVSLTFQFVTSATVANRTVRIEFGTGRSGVWYREICGSVQQASTTSLYSASIARGFSDIDTNNFISMPLLAVPLEPGQPLQINVTNVDGADQLSAIIMAFAVLTYD